MALMQRDQELQEEEFGLRKQDRTRGIAKDLLTDAGPTGNLDPAAVEAVTAGGYGHRVRPAVETDPVTFSPIVGGSASVIPTAAEGIKLNEQQVVERARQAIADPRFYAMPPERRATVWQQAGMNGAPPASPQEALAQQQPLLDYAHQQRMEEIEAQRRIALETATVRANTPRGNTRLPINFVNNIAEIDDALRQVSELTDPQSGVVGDTGLFPSLGYWTPNAVTEYTGIGEDAKQRVALINLTRQVIGKGLEGGVLRKEDEIKYKDILPVINDPPEVVRGKLSNLQKMLQGRREIVLQTIEGSGYDTSGLQSFVPKIQRSLPRDPANPGAPPVSKFNLVQVP
jgi:hypothetical protein